MKNFTILNKLGKSYAFFTSSLLGEGAFSTVYRVKRLSDNQIYALKKVRRSKNLSQKSSQGAYSNLFRFHLVNSQKRKSRMH